MKYEININTNWWREPFSTSVKLYRVSQNERIPSRGSCGEKSQESRKNKIKNTGGAFTKIYGSEEFSSNKKFLNSF
jgi:hypothetical protein